MSLTLSRDVERWESEILITDVVESLVIICVEIVHTRVVMMCCLTIITYLDNLFLYGSKHRYKRKKHGMDTQTHQFYSIGKINKERYLVVMVCTNLTTTTATTITEITMTTIAVTAPIIIPDRLLPISSFAPDL